MLKIEEEGFKKNFNQQVRYPLMNLNNYNYLAEDFNTILEKKFNDNIGKYPADISCLKYNDLILEFDKIFEEKYFSESALDLLYDVYRKYSICNVIFYPLFAVYEKYRRKEERWSEFNISQIEKSVFTTHSYIESFEIVKNIILEYGRKHVEYEGNSLIGYIRGYSDIKGSFEEYIYNFIKIYHLMYCELFDVTYRDTKRGIGLACGYIVKNHVKISDQDFLSILDWAERKIIFDGYTILSDVLIENMKQIDLPLITEDNWVVNKEVLALVFTYKKALIDNGFGDAMATFQSDKMFMCAMTCNTLEEYISNTRNVLKNVDYLQLDETEKNIYKNVIVIQHIFYIYEFGLDMPQTFIKEATKSTARSDFYNEYLKKEIKKNNTKVNTTTLQVKSNVDDTHGNKSEIREKAIILLILMYIAAGAFGYFFTVIGGIGGVFIGWILLTLLMFIPMVLKYILVAIIGYALAGLSGLIVGCIGLFIICKIFL